jgi:hypothetical protein
MRRSVAPLDRAATTIAMRMAQRRAAQRWYEPDLKSVGSLQQECCRWSEMQSVAHADRRKVTITEDRQAAFAGWTRRSWISSTIDASTIRSIEGA